MVVAVDPSYDPIAELYDTHPIQANRQDVDFFVEEAKNAGGPVLELGCGTGRVLLPIARAGVEIVGLDASAGMLACLRAKLERESQAVQQRVQVVQGDMRAFHLGRKFALVTIPFRPFQHLVTVPDQLACLKCIRKHLDSEGRLILDLFNPRLEALVDKERLIESQDGPSFELEDGSEVVRYVQLLDHDPLEQVQEVQMRYEIRRPDGQVEERLHRFTMRHLFRFEAEHLLARAGFEVVELYADYDRSPYGFVYPGELIFLARPT